MGRVAGPDIVEARQQGRPDDVVVAEYGRPHRQVLGDAAQLAPVEHLAVRQVDVGDPEGAEIEDLADPVDQGARGQGDHPRRGRPGVGLHIARPWMRRGSGAQA